MESLYQLDLVPAFVVLCTVLLFHQFSKHHQTKLEKERIIAKTEQTQARMSEVTRLLTLAQALTNVVEKSALEAVLRQQFPRFMDQRDLLGAAVPSGPLGTVPGALRGICCAWLRADRGPCAAGRGGRPSRRSER